MEGSNFNLLVRLQRGLFFAFRLIITRARSFPGFSATEMMDWNAGQAGGQGLIAYQQDGHGMAGLAQALLAVEQGVADSRGDHHDGRTCRQAGVFALDYLFDRSVKE